MLTDRKYCIKSLCFNINRVECKLGAGALGGAVALCFNINRVECKLLSNSSMR